MLARHASIIPTYRRIGLEAQGIEATQERLASAIDQESVIAGFKAVSQKKYEEVHAEFDAIVSAQKAGGKEEEFQPIRALQRKAMWRLDYISSENSKGFHADQEAVRILGESIDYSRQAQAAAYKLGL